MEPTGVHNSTSAGSRCNYPAHICAVCLRGGTYTRLGSITRASCTARFVPFYKQRTHQLSDAPRRPGRSGRPVIQLGLPVSLVGCWSFGWSVGSVHRLSRAATGRSGGWSVVRSVGQSDGSVGPPDRSVDSADRSAGRWVGRRHRADTEASVISPTTSHSNSEHCPRKKNVTLASTSCRHSPPFGPDNATWSRIMWFLNISLPSQHWRAANEPRSRAP